MTAWLKIFMIFIPAVMQAIYDYLGWNTILGENPKKFWHELVFRAIKLTLDYPVTWYLLKYHCGWDDRLIESFYIAKQCGLCDMIYIGIWKLLHPGQDYTSEGIWWLWWTPLGAIISIYNVFKIGFLPNAGMTEWWKRVRGTMSFKQFEIELAVGLAATILFYLRVI